jgi:hypothetical protein
VVVFLFFVPQERLNINISECFFPGIYILVEGLILNLVFFIFASCTFFQNSMIFVQYFLQGLKSLKSHVTSCYAKNQLSNDFNPWLSAASAVNLNCTGSDASNSANILIIQSIIFANWNKSNWHSHTHTHKPAASKAFCFPMTRWINRLFYCSTTRQ